MQYIAVKLKYLSQQEIDLLTESQQAELLRYDRNTSRQETTWLQRTEPNYNITPAKPTRNLKTILKRLKLYNLNKADRKMILLWIAGYNQVEIGAKYNISQPQVSRKLNRIIKIIASKAQAIKFIQDLQIT